jgi:uncharacterized protein YcbK (DUF882 family)
MNQWDHRYFKPEEFDCHCKECKGKDTGLKNMDSAFMGKLDYARMVSGVAYAVKKGCGYRCKSHNKSVGGSRTSLHPEGKAADIPFKNKTICYKILKGLFVADFRRIQVYQRSDGSGWIHVDTYKGKSKPNQWFSIKAI